MSQFHGALGIAQAARPGPRRVADGPTASIGAFLPCRF